MRRVLSRLGLAPALAAVLALLAGAALAYFVAAATGSGTAKVATLATPSVTKSTPAGTSVELAWSAVTPPGTGTVTYYVTRDGGAPAGNCPTSSAPTAVTSCTDTGLSPGSHSYTVTAVWRSWTARSAAREAVTPKTTQTINFTSTAPSKATVGEASYKVTAEATSKLAVSLSSASESVCTLSGSGSGATVTLKAAGTCVIDANQAGNGEYEAAPQAAQQFAVKKTQTIKFTSTQPSKATLGGVAYTVTATGGASGQPVTLSIPASAKAICSLSGSSSGSSVSFTGVGTCVIDANQAGNGEYEAAAQEAQSFSVAKGAQSIKFTSTQPSKAALGGAAYTVTASGGASGEPVTLSIPASAKAICSLSGSSSGSSVSFTGVGTCVIDANQAGNGEYEAAAQEAQSFSVGKSAQTVKFTSTAPGKATIGESSYEVSATASSGLAVTLESLSTTICTVSHSTSPARVTTKAAGTCQIKATQAGNESYEAAPAETQSFAVAKRQQTIQFTSAAPSRASIGEATYKVNAEASSALPVTLASASESVCTLSSSSSGATVTMKALGTCVIHANQSGSGEYEAAAQATQEITVAKKLQTIAFSPALAAATVGEKIKVSAEASSKLTVTLEAAPGSVCKAKTSFGTTTLEALAAGICVLTAEQSGNGTYEAVQEAEEITVSKKAQTIKFSTPPSKAIVNEDSYKVSAEASSKLTPVTLESESPSICTLSTTHGTTTVDMKATGTCVIGAEQAGNGEYEAVQEAQDIIVGKKAQTVRFTSTAPKALVGEKTYKVTAEATSKLAVTLESEDTAVCTLSGSLSGATVTMKSAGTCVIVAKQAGTGEYEAAEEEQDFAVGLKLTLAVEGSGTSYAFSGEGLPGATVTVDVCKDDEASCKHLEGSALTTTVASNGLWLTGPFTFKVSSTLYADASEVSTGETAGPLRFTTGN